MSSEIYAMANLIRNLADAQDDGLALDPAALRSHAASGDLLSWLQDSFPHHFYMDGISASDRMLISEAMKETAHHDTGGTYGPKTNGFLIMIAWLSYVIGKLSENRW
jgi:hypothetical protein